MITVSALTHLRSRDLLKRNSKLFAAALLVALAGSVAGPNPALAGAPQHHDQVPGFYRMKVGDLEVTALLDGYAPLVPRLHNVTNVTIYRLVSDISEHS